MHHFLADSTENAFLINGIHHVGVVVQDLQRMVRFYTEEIGLQVQLELNTQASPEGDHTGVPGARRTLVFLGCNDGCQLELVHYHEPPAASGHLDKHQLGAMHVCFSVDNLQCVYQTLSGKGVRFVSEPKYSEPPGKGRVGVAYAQDPEGNWLEFIEWNAAT